MTPTTFVKGLAGVALPNVFNPYRDVCEVHDRQDAPALRRRNLRAILTSAVEQGLDTIWMGRDLGYRGGRRTGLALTDERNLRTMHVVYPGVTLEKSTLGPEVAERTAAEIWAVIGRLARPPILWNVFPLHPHEPDDSFTNRRFSSRELAEVDGLNAELFRWLGITHVVSIGQDAASYAAKFGVKVSCVRHPSYGGVSDFRRGIGELYDLDLSRPAVSNDQPSLF